MATQTQSQLRQQRTDEQSQKRPTFHDSIVAARSQLRQQRTDEQSKKRPTFQDSIVAARSSSSEVGLFHVAAVVGSEVDEGVVLLPQSAECVQQLPHAPVQFLQRLHSSLICCITSCPCSSRLLLPPPPSPSPFSSIHSLLIIFKRPLHYSSQSPVNSRCVCVCVCLPACLSLSLSLSPPSLAITLCVCMCVCVCLFVCVCV